MSYNLSLLLEKNNLQVTQQPYDLQMAAADSKLITSMSLSVSAIFVHARFQAPRPYWSNEATLVLQILKYEQPEPTSEEDEDDHDINQLNKRIERQESNISSILPSSGK